MHDKQILYKSYIQPVRDAKGLIVKSGHMQEDFLSVGRLIHWGIAATEFEYSAASTTVGLVIIEDGTIVEVDPAHIKFPQTEGKF